MAKLLDLMEIIKTEKTFHKALEYFASTKDEYTDEIVEQISGALITLELVKNKENQLEYEERILLSEQMFELRNNVVETIKSEGGVI